MDLELERTTVLRKDIDVRARDITSALERAHIKPDFTTALALLGTAVLQLGDLGAVESNVREAVEYWLAQRKTTPALVRAPKPSKAYIQRVMQDWLGNNKH